ncbi:hypothetical protein L1987_49195 [Smallanthus sonchifolius]|uniref:Uncharacterized protein n=1 Tax=Smallanthus sonchifolius TaxID=185202 RepID=A0ACB9FUJ6_9ASTR|nr:hypothetical protein L1987_49195 [Smallanthus sonchifolius]
MRNRYDIALGFAIIMAIICSSHAQDSPQEYVDAHNSFRKDLGLPPLTWDDTVAEFAKNFAAERKDDCALVHSKPPRKYGENLAYGPELNATGAVFLWGREKAFYDYDTNTCSPGKRCGHYTQIVWKDTLKVGCDRVMCTNTPMCYVICSYDPPGNYIDTKPY